MVTSRAQCSFLGSFLAMSGRPNPTFARATLRSIGLRAIGLGAIVLVGMGCPADPRDLVQSPIVAKVGTEALTRVEVLTALTTAASARLKEAATRKRQARAVLSGLIDAALLHQGAQHDGLQVADEEVARAIRKSSGGYPPGEFRRMLDAEQITFAEYKERVRRRLTNDAFLKKMLAKARQVDSALLQKRYQATVANHPHLVEVRVRQVLVKTDEEADYILSEIQKKHLRLEEAARRYSVAPEASSGGDLGWFSHGQLPQVFDVCFTLKPGEISDVVSSEYGFHIFELIARQAGKAPPTLEESRAALNLSIVREQETAERKTLLARLKKTYRVTIDEKAFAEVIALLPSAPQKALRAKDAQGRAWSTYNSGDSRNTAGTSAAGRSGAGRRGKAPKNAEPTSTSMTPPPPPAQRAPAKAQETP